jgi:sec-independent protein translocase protein TatC
LADAHVAGEAGLPGIVPAGPAPLEPAPLQPAPDAPPAMSAEVGGTMSLVDHLGELRTRLFKSILAIVVFGIVGYWRSGAIIDILRAPIGDRPLVSLSASGPFFLYVKISFVVGLILALPVVLYQMWAFVSPGLTPEERRVVRPWVPVALLFFAIGVAVAWIVLPFALGFLFSFETDAIHITMTIDNYFGFVTVMFLAFGLTMQFPIALFILSRIGVVSSTRLREARRYVILGMAVFSTVVTPGGDLVSPLVLGLTMYVLFEISIFVIRRSGH